MRVEYVDVAVDLDGRRIVDAVSLTVEDGEFVGIIGPNGSGKSTLLRGLYRALTPAQGHILVGERDNRAISMR